MTWKTPNEYALETKNAKLERENHYLRMCAQRYGFMSHIDNVLDTFADDTVNLPNNKIVTLNRLVSSTLSDEDVNTYRVLTKTHSQDPDDKCVSYGYFISKQEMDNLHINHKVNIFAEMHHRLTKDLGLMITDGSL